MANEASIVELYGNEGDVVTYTVADATAITKGTILRLHNSGTRTAKASSASGELPVGIAAADKVASDGSTKIGVYTNGVFILTLGIGAVNPGDLLIISGANLVVAAKGYATQAQIYTSGMILGKALETIAASGTGQVRVGPL